MCLVLGGTLFSTMDILGGALVVLGTALVCLGEPQVILWSFGVVTTFVVMFSVVFELLYRSVGFKHKLA